MKQIRTPKKAIPLVLFQRTQYLKNSQFFKLLSFIGTKRALYKSSIILKSLLFSKGIIEEFTKDMLKEYETIRNYMPETCDKIMDIGCGVAGIEVVIERNKTQKNATHYYLIDKTQIDKKYTTTLNSKDHFIIP